jgi:hypothetical protein
MVCRLVADALLDADTLLRRQRFLLMRLDILWRLPSYGCRLTEETLRHLARVARRVM